MEYRSHLKGILTSLAIVGSLLAWALMATSVKVTWLESPASQVNAKNLVVDDRSINQLLPPISDIAQLLNDYIFVPDIKNQPALAAVANIPSSKKADNVVSLYSPQLTRQLQAKGLTFGAPVLIRIFKVPSILEIWVKKDNKFVLFKTYAICRFSGRLGPKTKNGDRQAPEGFYTVYPKQLNPNSSYFLSFDLGYPNAYDKYYKRTGSALMVHGECASVGCYAMSNARIAEIYTLMYGAFAKGQPSVQVQVYPFALTDNNMHKMRKHTWYNFWANLKVGYDAFARTHQALPVSVVNGRYQFTP